MQVKNQIEIEKVKLMQNNKLEEFDTLPPEAQKQVVDFIAFLQERYQTSTTAKSKPKGKLTDESFVGIWRSREDMQDSSAWVRKVRAAEWG
jgi:hypothetical protein